MAVKRLYRVVLDGAKARGVILTEHLQALLDWGKRMHEVILHEHDEQGRHKLPFHAKGYLRIDTLGTDPNGVRGPRIISAALGSLSGDDAFSVARRVGVGEIEVTAKGPWPRTVHWVTGFMTGLNDKGGGGGARVCLKVTRITNGLRIERRLFLPHTGALPFDGEFSLILYGEW